MSGKIRLSKSSISQAEKEAVFKVLDKEYLGMGEEVKLFEQKIKEYLQTSMNVVCVSTGTSALHLALSALGLQAGDEVLVPSLTYVASYQAISATGAKPISCEINPKTLFIDAQDARAKITQNTKAIMPVHYASCSKGMEEVYKLAQEFNLRVVEDAAQAFGSKRDGKLVGVEGDIICFSFDGIKNITSGEGGAILSNNQEFTLKVQDGRLLGVEKDTEKRYSSQRSWDFDVKEQGFRYHMSNIMAAIGIVQMDRIEEFKTKRQKIAKIYCEALSDVAQVKLLDFNFNDVFPHIFVIKVQKRDELRTYLIDNNIECGIHYKPNHLHTKYKSECGLPRTEQIYEEILTLPCHFDLTEEEQNTVIDKIREFYENKEPLVSILMNGYNAQKYLKEAIESVYAQTYKDWEIIFIDNCSTDSTKNIVKSYDKKIKYYKTDKNIPLGAARNFGLQYCNGTYIAFLDTDDIWLEHKLELQVQIMDENPDMQMCYGGVIYIDESGTKRGETVPQAKSGNVFAQQLRRYEINMQSVLLRNNATIKFNEELRHSPDFDLFMHIASVSKVHVIADFIVKYRKLINSLTSKNIDVWGSEMQYTLDKIFENAKDLKEKYPKEYQTAYAKVAYNKACYFISAGNKKEATKELSRFKYVNLHYFILFLTSFISVKLWHFLHKYK